MPAVVTFWQLPEDEQEFVEFLERTGDVLAVAGENLQKEAVAKVYLTDGKTDIEVTITEQTEKEIKFKIPAKAAGRLALMVLTAGKDAKLIEQPVKVQIDE